MRPNLSLLTISVSFFVLFTAACTPNGHDPDWTIVDQTPAEAEKPDDGGGTPTELGLHVLDETTIDTWTEEEPIVFEPTFKPGNRPPPQAGELPKELPPELQALALEMSLKCENECTPGSGTIMYLFTDAGEEKIHHCSGFVSDKNQFITNSHCLPPGLTAKDCSSKVLLAFIGEDKKLRFSACNSLVSKSRYNFKNPEKTENLADVAILEMSVPLEDGSFKIAKSGFARNQALSVLTMRLNPLNAASAQAGSTQPEAPADATGTLDSHVAVVQAPEGAPLVKNYELVFTERSCQTVHGSLLLPMFWHRLQDVVSFGGEQCTFKKGDSGSLIVNAEDKAIGVLHAQREIKRETFKADGLTLPETIKPVYLGSNFACLKQKGLKAPAGPCSEVEKALEKYPSGQRDYMTKILKLQIEQEAALLKSTHTDGPLKISWLIGGHSPSQVVLSPVPQCFRNLPTPGAQLPAPTLHYAKEWAFDQHLRLSVTLKEIGAQQTRFDVKDGRTADGFETTSTLDPKFPDGAELKNLSQSNTYSIGLCNE